MENQQQQNLLKKSLIYSKSKCIAFGNIGLPFGNIVSNLKKNDILLVKCPLFNWIK